jgi:hypothetical protein
MGQDGDEITDILQLLKRAGFTAALMMLPDALTDVRVTKVVRHRVLSEGVWCLGQRV